ncbi:MAG: hypothetical protein ABI687_08795 [Flavitalea sp.]
MDEVTFLTNAEKANFTHASILIGLIYDGHLGRIVLKAPNADHVLKDEYMTAINEIMKVNEEKVWASAIPLTDHEMKQICGGAIWDKLLSALLSVTIGAFYDMGREEGRIARQQVKSIIQPL